jgi:hypothetical protein
LAKKVPVSAKLPVPVPESEKLNLTVTVEFTVPDPEAFGVPVKNGFSITGLLRLLLLKLAKPVNFGWFNMLDVIEETLSE